MLGSCRPQAACSGGSMRHTATIGLILFAATLGCRPAADLGDSVPPADEPAKDVISGHSESVGPDTAIFREVAPEQADAVLTVRVSIPGVVESDEHTYPLKRNPEGRGYSVGHGFAA